MTADNFGVHRRPNALLQPVAECVYPYVASAGHSGEVVWTSPGQRGCVECLTNAEQRAAADVSTRFRALGIYPGI